MKDQLYTISRSEFYEWLFGPEKFSGLSRNRPVSFWKSNVSEKRFLRYMKISSEIPSNSEKIMIETKVEKQNDNRRIRLTIGFIFLQTKNGFRLDDENWTRDKTLIKHVGERKIGKQEEIKFWVGLRLTIMRSKRKNFSRDVCKDTRHAWSRFWV